MLRLLTVLVFVASGLAVRFSDTEQCSWLPDNSDRSSSKLSVTCKVRNLEENANITSLPTEITSRLKIFCRRDVFVESVLPVAGLHRLHELDELQIKNCKILSIPPSSFSGLYNVKSLFINTFNTEWGPNKYLEISSYSFEGLKELKILNLSDNNIRAVPDGIFCSLINLQTLNLTRNRIRHPERIGLNVPDCTNSRLLNLDLTFNDLRSLNEDAGFSRLRRLQHLYLQYNNITEISDETLTGLVSLKVLNLTYNKISSLPEGLFAGTPDIKEIHLGNNMLSSLAKGSFHRLEQLLVLNLSTNLLTSTDINAGTFAGLIRLIVLDLSHNAITRLDGRTFKDLYFLQILELQNNSIGFIEDNTFLPLYNLHTLNLAENRLNTIGLQLFNGLFVLNKLTLNNNLIVNIDPRAFVNCSALKDLDLSSNAISEVPVALQELTFLKNLDLGENRISEFHNGSFRNLNQLTGLRLIDNNINNLTVGMLWDLPSLQVFNLAKNKLQGIERGSFDHNPQIEAIRLDDNFLTDINGLFATLSTLLWLNLSKNHLVWFDYAFIPSNLQWLDIHGNFIEHLGNYYKIQKDLNLKTLDASHNRILEISAMSIPNTVDVLFINNNFIKTVQPNTFFEKSNLVRVDLYSNDIVSMDLSALRLAPVPENRSLPIMYFGGNPLNCDCSMEWLQLINDMSASRQYPKLMDLENTICRMTHSRGMMYMAVSDVKQSDFLCTYETHCFALCHCCDFDACDCEMTCPSNCTCYHDRTWSNNVVDCSSKNSEEIPQKIPMDATELFLDGNNIRELPNHVFIGRKNLRVLYVNNSEVITIQNSTFNGLQSLQVLHLEDNKIQELQGCEFDQLLNLKELYLQNNEISIIANNTFDPLPSLEILRLEGNKLVNYPVWQLSVNTRLTFLTLGNNRWTCHCLFLQNLIVWVADNAAKVVDSVDMACYKLDSLPPKARELNFNTTVCNDFYEDSSVIDSMIFSDYWPMIVITLCFVIFLLLVVVLWFVFRDPFRLWLYSKYGVRLCNFGGASAAKQCEDKDKLYDGFVCYSPKDDEWVIQVLAVELESKFQLCLQYRDLLHTAYIQHAAPAILEAAESSRRVIMVLTRNFLQTEWSRFELRQAIHESLKTRAFKLVILEEGPLPEAELDPDLKPYLKTSERVRWGEKRFWEKLRYAMPSVESRGKINANYRRNVNNYTIETRVVANGTHHTHHTYPEKIRTQGPPSPVLQMLPPSYSTAVPQEADDANYSSATTATPSPRPTRRAQEPRPISDHIYSSIDSDYSTLERGGSGRRAPPWRHHHVMIPAGMNNGGQAYLV